MKRRDFLKVLGATALGAAVSSTTVSASVTATDSCGACMFFNQQLDENGEPLSNDGVCRRYPEYQNKKTWHWCGEFECR